MMQFTEHSKNNLISDITTLFTKNKYGSSTCSMNNIKTIYFNKKNNKQNALLRILLSLPTTLIDIINDYTLEIFNTHYSITYIRSNIEDILISMNIELNHFKCRLNIYAINFSSFNITMFNVDTNMFNEEISNYIKEHYYLVHDYLFFFNKYMEDQHGKNEFIKQQYTLDCKCDNKVKYKKKSKNTYVSNSVCNKSNVMVKRVILNHKQLYSTILIIRTILNTIINTIKTRVKN